MIIGAVGCGKSLLMLAILGETPGAESSIRLAFNGSIAFCGQTPWLQNKSIQANIIEHVSELSWHQIVIDAYDLGPDLTELTEGDSTPVASSRMCLSGGQKHRIVRPLKD